MQRRGEDDLQEDERKQRDGWLDGRTAVKSPMDPLC